MLDYKIAKELKEAGFPMPEHDFDFEMPSCHRCDNVDAEFCIPTLEELIEACGEGLDIIEKFSREWQAGLTECDDWSGGCCSLSTGKPYGAGATPTEAVARLYLSLQRDRIGSNDKGSIRKNQGHAEGIK